MLEQGGPAASSFLAQLACAEATMWRCACGCASFDFKVAGQPKAPPGVGLLGEFMVDEGPDSYGVFIYQSDGILSGVEVYGLGGDAPKTLPEPQQLRPLPLGVLG